MSSTLTYFLLFWACGGGHLWRLINLVRSIGSQPEESDGLEMSRPSNISNWIWYGRSGVSACTDVVGSINVISDDVYFHTAAYMLAQYIVVMTSFGFAFDVLSVQALPSLATVVFASRFV